MKKILLSSLVMLLAFASSFAQEEIPQKEKEDTSSDVSINIKIGGDDDPEESEEKSGVDLKTSWIGLDMGLSTYMQNGSFSMSDEYAPFQQRLGRSFNWELHIFRQRLSFAKSHLSLNYGLSLDWQRYTFENDVTLQAGQPQVTFTEVADVDFKRNRLTAMYLKMPLYLQYEINPSDTNRSARFGIGAYGALRMGSWYKQKSDALGKTSERDDFNLEQFQYGIHARFGISAVTFYGNFALSELFRESENAGYALNPVSIGIVLVGFH